MNPSDKNEKKLTPTEKAHLMALHKDYRRVLHRELRVQQELLMLHMDLIPMLIKQSAYKSHIERWAQLVRELR
ncbi:MAG: hypothetical protein V3V61_05380 [Gammaproteobacteria bacterium]